MHQRLKICVLNVQLVQKHPVTLDLLRVPSAMQGHIRRGRPMFVLTVQRDNTLFLVPRYASIVKRASTARAKAAAAVLTAVVTHTLMKRHGSVFSADGCTITLHSLRNFQIDVYCALRELLVREMAVRF